MISRIREGYTWRPMPPPSSISFRSSACRTRAAPVCSATSFARKGVVKVAVGQNHIFDADAELVHFLQDFVGRRAGVYDKTDVGRIGFDHIAVCLYGSHFQS